MSTMPPVESLPPYLYSDCCAERHYLSINRDVHGNWSAGYVEYEQGTAVGGLYINNAVTLSEVATRLEAKLERWKRVKTQ